MDVKLIKRRLKSGRISLVLEYYMGYTINEKGGIKPIRRFETLKYFLYANPTDKKEREHNRMNLEMAEQVKAKRLLESQNNSYGFSTKKNVCVNLVEYVEKLMDLRKESPGNWGNWKGMLKHLEKYAGRDTTFEMVDKSFVLGFKKYLVSLARTKSGQPLSSGSQNSYFLKFKTVLNKAVEDGILKVSPAVSVKSIYLEDVHREYLTFEELQQLVKTECRYAVLKNAFIFSCLTGMRWSDIYKLTWKEVQRYDGAVRVVFRQKKTRGFEYLYIADQALEYMGKRGKAEERVFPGLKYSVWYNLALGEWCRAAGITKHITFHCARHTFAVMQLTLGTEIYTVSKLLGHRELKTTQIYAQIVDEKKREAVNKIPKL